MPALRLAAHLGVIVIAPSAIPGISADVLQSLLGTWSDLWSAVTIVTSGQPLIVYNASHAETRQQSDLMHELAHLICEHKPARIEPPGRFPWALRTFDPVQEHEAEWFGGCLQIPRAAILFLVRRGYDNESIAKQFSASEDMVRFRRNMTGVDKQIARAVSFFGRMPRVSP